MPINLSCNVDVMKAEAGQAIHWYHEEETSQLNKRHPVCEVRPTNNS